MSSELATSYAALILADDGIEISVKTQESIEDGQDGIGWHHGHLHIANGWVPEPPPQGWIQLAVDDQIGSGTDQDQLAKGICPRFFRDLTFSSLHQGEKSKAGDLTQRSDAGDSDKLNTLLKGANVEVESIWVSLFAKALEGKDVASMLSNVGSGGAAPAAAGGAAAAAGGAAAEEKKEEKEEAKEESDEDMGFGLFD
ncbi:hypothetical protein BGX31_000833 [Mortierella sp. GBA43]|nr:hypothetical protein BGX31_000833 [Mortierella sp. GBA43]